MGFRVGAMTGDIKPDGREAIASSLSKSDGPHVLVISGVAMTGINLSRAHIMILMVRTWIHSMSRDID
jgi:hypothetical protein